MFTLQLYRFPFGWRVLTCRILTSWKHMDSILNISQWPLVVPSIVLMLHIYMLKRFSGKVSAHGKAIETLKRNLFSGFFYSILETVPPKAAKPFSTRFCGFNVVGFESSRQYKTVANRVTRQTSQLLLLYHGTHVGKQTHLSGSTF